MPKSENNQPVPFRALMTKERSGVVERLQLYGDLPSVGPERACDVDWLHVLMASVTEAAERVRVRVDGHDPLSTKALKRQLAIAAAACEMWADSLEAR